MGEQSQIESVRIAESGFVPYSIWWVEIASRHKGVAAARGTAGNGRFPVQLRCAKV